MGCRLRCSARTLAGSRPRPSDGSRKPGRRSMRAGASAISPPSVTPYFWADGTHVQARLEDAAQCLLVIIGATPEGKKELVGLIDGVRVPHQGSRCAACLLRLPGRALETSAYDERYRKLVRDRAPPKSALQGMSSNKTALAMIMSSSRPGASNTRRQSHAPFLVSAIQISCGARAWLSTAGSSEAAEKSWRASMVTISRRKSSSV